tara:strand:+ start:403 stop:552 length:150 start_codon:yes stop_codon:yes gene_type:complete
MKTKRDYVRYMCNFTPDQYEKLKEKSDRDGIPIAYQVRTAVKEYQDKES